MLVGELRAWGAFVSYTAMVRPTNIKLIRYLYSTLQDSADFNSIKFLSAVNSSAYPKLLEPHHMFELSFPNTGTFYHLIATVFFHEDHQLIIRPWSVDSLNGRSTDVHSNGKNSDRKKSRNPFIFILASRLLSLQLLALQKWFAYQNLQKVKRKTT